MVVRFNNAPTTNYTEDVGSKTTFRIVNSQLRKVTLRVDVVAVNGGSKFVDPEKKEILPPILEQKMFDDLGIQINLNQLVVAKPEYNFLEDPLYSNVSILVWDPANYSSSLDDWFRSPDHPLFQVYKRFLELNPNADVHLLNPQVLWDLWTLLQSSAPNRIRKNPPSSGFIGIWFAMHRCANVRVFEFVPSSRATARCHYYSPHKDRHCTLGSWHPLSQEKILANLMRNNSDFETYQRGFINIPGASSFDCPD